jgi:hypothetical protein
MYITPLRTADPLIFGSKQLYGYLSNLFSDVTKLLTYHQRLLDRLCSIQMDEHPQITSVTLVILAAFMNFLELYPNYVTNYPIAAYMIEHEKANNTRFKEFYDVRKSFFCNPLQLS